MTKENLQKKLVLMAVEIAKENEVLTDDVLLEMQAALNELVNK